MHLRLLVARSLLIPAPLEILTLHLLEGSFFDRFTTHCDNDDSKESDENKRVFIKSHTVCIDLNFCDLYEICNTV